VQISCFVEPMLGDSSMYQILSHQVTNPAHEQKMSCISRSSMAEDCVLQDKKVRHWVIGPRCFEAV
jgi:hypothetical protein